MLLCIDIGNTNIVLGLYRGEELAASPPITNAWPTSTPFC